MVENPKISLIIPAYNEEKFIGNCLESVEKSRGNIFEVLVINNASTDRTKEIAEKFPFVRVIDEPEKGLTRARQRGFLEAKGDILAYIDSDTKINSSWPEEIKKEFLDKSVVSLSGPYEYYDVSSWNKFLVKIYWYILAWPTYLLVGYMVIGGNFAIRRETLEKMNGFDVSIEFYGEDTNIARRASRFGKAKFDLSFAIETSARRLSGQGIFKTSFVYMGNYLSEVIFHKPLTKKYIDFR